MKKILLLTSIVLGFVMQVNAACYQMTVKNTTSCTLYYIGYTNTPPSCTGFNNTNVIQIPPGGTITYCVGTPGLTWSPSIPNSVNDRWVAIRVFTDPTSSCGTTGVMVGGSCGFTSPGVFSPPSGSSCGYTTCPVIKVTWTVTSPLLTTVIIG